MIGELVPNRCEIFNVRHLDPITIARCLILLEIIAMTKAFALVNLIELLLVALFLLNQGLRALFLRALRHPVSRAAFLFWLWISISAIWSSAPIEERLSDILSWRKLILLPICIALFDSKIWADRALTCLVSICSLYLIVSYVQLFTDDFFGNISPWHVLENHSTQGILFSASALILVHNSILRPSFTRTLLPSFLIASLFIVNVAMSTGRSGIVFVSACCIVFSAALWFKRSVMSKIFVVLIFFFLALVVYSKRDTIVRGINEIEKVVDSSGFENRNYDSTLIRLYMWKKSMDIIQQAPILGTGTGGFKYSYAEVNLEAKKDWLRYVSDDPHNQYLHITAEYGLVGLFLFLFILVRIFSSLTINFPVGSYSFIGLSFLVGIFFTSFFNGHFSSFVEGRFFWIFVSIMLAACLKPSHSLKDNV